MYSGDFYQQLVFVTAAWTNGPVKVTYVQENVELSGVFWLLNFLKTKRDHGGWGLGGECSIKRGVLENLAKFTGKAPVPASRF